ncbi:MAG: 23S rRNA pseudouridine2605 synthase [Sphingobacteriales bacterium]
MGGRDSFNKRPEQGAGSEDYRTSRSGKSYAGHKNFAIPKTSTSEIRLNKYIADCGVCTRREADTLIEAGAIEVNGVIITEMGKKVSPNDVIKYGGQTLSRTKAVYFVLNKPKNIDSRPTGGQGQRSVYDLMRGSTKERIAPVGELDRMTSGVLIFTNDGNMAKKLTHPRLKCHKIYHVTTEKSITAEHMALLKEGIELKDGISKVDNIEYVDGSGKSREIGVEISTGKRKIVTRMLEQLGYKILKLDRVSFAGLNKKNIPRGKYRELSEKEVGFLRML